MEAGFLVLPKDALVFARKKASNYQCSKKMLVNYSMTLTELIQAFRIYNLC